MELTVIKQVQEFQWNFDEIKSALAEHIEKYTGLVVTKDNLKDMEAAQKEIASVRIKIDGFRKEVKKRLEEPYKQFEVEIKELQGLVEQAEAPLKEQILKYEDERAKKLEEELLVFGRNTASSMGLKTVFCTRFTIKPDWLKRTAKLSATKKEIVTEIEALLEQQSTEQQAEELKQQRFKLIEQLCASQSKAFNLSTEITMIDVAPMVEGAGLADIPVIITNVCEKRAAMERKAAEEAAEKIRSAAEAAKPKPSEPPEPIPVTANTEFIPGETYEFGGDDIPAPPVKSIPLPPRAISSRPAFYAPPPPPVVKEPEQCWSVDLQLIAVTVPQAEALKEYMTKNGIAFKFSNYEKVNPF